MIDQKHYESVVANNRELIKKNTQLHAQISHLHKEVESFKQATMTKVESTIRLYDRHNAKVLKYLSDNNLVSPEHLQNIADLFPIKIK